MRGVIKPLFYSSAIFIAVCLLVVFAIKPLSLINFIGPVTGIITAVTLVWGSIALAGVIISSLLLLMIVNKYAYFDLNLAIVLFIFLAALLQAFWAKQLTYKLIGKQRWIASRSSLFSFMLKIGPVVGIVAASCAVIVAILDNGTFDTSLTYAFFRAWSTSVLVSAFTIPSLLFIVGEQKLSVSKRTFVFVSSTLGCVAIGLLFQISQQQELHKRLDIYERSLHELNDVLVKEISDIKSDIKAMSAYFNSSVEVDFDEFNSYSNEVYRDNSSISSIQWAPVVTAQEQQRFEQYAKSQLGIEYTIVTKVRNQPLEPQNKTLFVPVLYLFPEKGSETYYGFDLHEYTAITPTLMKSLEKQDAVASAPFSMNQNNEMNPLIIIAHPVSNAKGANVFGYITLASGELAIGFLSAVIELERLVNTLKTKISANNITMTIVDVTAGENYLIYGDKLTTDNRLKQTEVVDFFGRQWKFHIAESTTWLSQDKSWQTWVMLLGAVFGGFIFQLLILMMAAYSIELSDKVAEKTRELIKANELSEKENQSKAHFLQMLTLELSTPIKLAERLSRGSSRNLGNSQLQQFNEVTEQLKHILTSVSDLSTIESRTQKLDSQVFDFSYFLNQIESTYQQREIHAHNQIKFLFDCELPNFVVADKNRLEKLLLSLQDNILKLFNGSDVQMSVKTHYHKDFASLFFTCSALSAKESMPILSWLKKDIANFSTSMALASELTYLLQGNIKLTLVPTGDVVMTISLPIGIKSQQDTLNKTDEIETLTFNNKRKVLLIEESLSTNFETTPLLLGLDYQVEIIDDFTEVGYAISELHFDIIIIDNITSKPYVKAIEESLGQLGKGDKTTVIGIYRGIEYRQLEPSFKQLMGDCLLYPISAENLQMVLMKANVS